MMPELKIPRPDLVGKEYRTLSQVKGPLLFAERIAGVGYNEIVEVIDPQGNVRLGQVLEMDRQHCMIRLYASSSGLSLKQTRLRFTGDICGWTSLCPC